MIEKDLKIRKMEGRDLDDLFQLLSDPKVMKYLEPVFSYERTKEFLNDAGLSDPPLIYAVEDEEGFCGYVIYHDHGDLCKEIGWVLCPSVWGRGYASQLTKKLIEKAENENKDVLLECVPEQKATARIANEYGFEYQGRSENLDVYRLYLNKEEQ